MVHNDLTEIGPDGHLATVYQHGDVVVVCATKTELAAALLARLTPAEVD